MIAKLSFVDSLFNLGLDLERRGSTAEACRTYERLLNIKSLPRKLAGECAGRLGKLELERGQFARARKHLQLSVARNPGNAEYQNLLARAIDGDEAADIDRAEKPYRNCVNLQPNNPRYLVDLACHLAERGENAEALDLYRRAFALGADNCEIVACVAEGLRQLGEFEEAKKVLLRAQFSHASDRRFRQLWNDHHFQLLWTRQQAARSRPAEDTPILRFVRSA